MKRLPDGRVDLAGEIPPVAMSLSSTAWNRTGVALARAGVPRPHRAVRGRLPGGRGRRRPAPARGAGPHRRRGGARALPVNPFPATTGRVCPHPCASACNRALLDGALDVAGVERAIGDALLAAGVGVRPRRASRSARPWWEQAPPGSPPRTAWRSPACACASSRPRIVRAGLLATGIPPVPPAARGARRGDRAHPRPRHRLRGRPRARRRARPRRARGRARRRRGRDRAACAARPRDPWRSGRRRGGRARAPGPGPPRPACAARRRGRRGRGGNTALRLCARTLVRLGRRVTVAYRRGRADMPALREEIEEALEEGIALEEWLLPAEVIVRGGRIRWLRLQRARPGAPDASGRRRPEPIPRGGPRRPGRPRRGRRGGRTSTPRPSRRSSSTAEPSPPIPPTRRRCAACSRRATARPAAARWRTRSARGAARPTTCSRRSAPSRFRRRRSRRGAQRRRWPGPS